MPVFGQKLQTAVRGRPPLVEPPGGGRGRGHGRGAREAGTQGALTHVAYRDAPREVAVAPDFASFVILLWRFFVHDRRCRIFANVGVVLVQKFSISDRHCVSQEL